jgi:hypothetical protein
LSRCERQRARYSLVEVAPLEIADDARSPHRQRVKRPDSRRYGHRRDGHRRDKQTDSAIRRSRALALAPSVTALAGKR